MVIRNVTLVTLTLVTRPCVHQTVPIPGPGLGPDQLKKNRRPKQFTKNRNNNVPAPFTAFRTKPVQLEEITPTLNDIVPRVPLQKDFNEVNKFPRQKNVIEKQTDLTKASNNDQEEERGAKQLNNNKNIYEDDDEDYEPTPEPEPSHHGDPRYHAFHSCQ